MKSGPSTTETKNATIPQHITDAQKYLINTGTNLTSPFTGQAPNYGVMGLTPDQLTAGDLTRQTAQGLFSKPQIPAYDVFGMGKDWQGQTSATPGMMANASNANAAQLDPNAIAPFMNPYIQTAINPVLDRLRQQQGEVQSRIGADAAASHMFGGSREAVSRMLADRNYRDTVGNTVGGMLMSGWDKASGLASGNTDRSQQTNQLNAQLGTQASIANASNANTLQQQQNNNLFQGSQNDANRFLEGLKLQGNLDTQDLSNKMSIINLLNSMGGQTRAVGQQAIDAPFTALQRQAQLLQGMAVPQSSTSTSQTEKPMDLMSLILGGAKLASGFMA